jgi:hypothetical protein
MISDINHFLQYIEKDNHSCPLSEALIRDYFQVQDIVPAYMRLCDELERVLNSHDYDMRKHQPFILICIHLKRIRRRLFFILKEAFVGTNYRKLFMKNRFLIKKMEKHISVMNRLRRDRGKNRASPEEVAEIFSKIQRIVNAVKLG